MGKEPLRIAFDGRVIKGKKSGVGVYAEGLINALAETDKKNNYKVLSNDVLQFNNPNFESAATRLALENHPFGDIWEQAYLPFYLNREKIDVFHSPTFHIPFFLKGCKRIATIHDMVAFRYPESQPRLFVAYSSFMTRLAIKSVDAVIVSSMAAKSELITMLRAEDNLLYVIPGAPRSIFFNTPDPLRNNEIKERYGLPEKFILFVGTIEPRKNIGALIKAYSYLRKAEKVPHKLVICGGKGWLNEYERLLNLIKEAGIIDDIVFTGYVSDDDLPYIYRGADLFVYPSLYEGFGLPLLEAMACGCPVAASNISVISEVAGNAAMLIDPLDVKGFSDAIFKALTDENLRKNLKELGHKRVKQFSWQRSAEATLKMYEDIAKK